MFATLVLVSPVDGVVVVGVPVNAGLAKGAFVSMSTLTPSNPASTAEKLLSTSEALALVVSSRSMVFVK
jgi:hypothetical protein